MIFIDDSYTSSDHTQDSTPSWSPASDHVVMLMILTRMTTTGKRCSCKWIRNLTVRTTVLLYLENFFQRWQKYINT